MYARDLKPRASVIIPCPCCAPVQRSTITPRACVGVVEILLANVTSIIDRLICNIAPPTVQKKDGS